LSPGCFWRKIPTVIRVLLQPLVLSGFQERPIGATLQLAAKGSDAPVVDEKCQPGFGARFPRATISIDKNDPAANLGGLCRRDEKIQRRGDAVAAGSHFAADGDVETADRPSVDLLGRWRERNVLRFAMRAVLPARRDRDVELPRQVRIRLVADEHPSELARDRRGVEQLVGREAGGGTTDDVPDVIHAGLERDETDGPKPRPDLRHVLDREPAELHLLARGDVGEAFAEFAAELADRAKLGCVADAVGDADAHHEAAGSLLAKKNPGPFEPLAVALADRFPPFPRVARHVVKNVEAVLFSLVFFDFIHVMVEKKAPELSRAQAPLPRFSVAAPQPKVSRPIASSF
jgi:hypothetical protein